MGVELNQIRQFVVLRRHFCLRALGRHGVVVRGPIPPRTHEIFIFLQ
jgi:hypothetical protein